MRYLVTLILSVLVIVAAFHFAKPLPNTQFDESFMPKANYVRYIAAGNNSTVAGLFWIKALTSLGESYLTGTEFAYLGHIADLCTDLDSLFYTPYYVVGGISAMDSPDTSDFKVFRRGIRMYPDDWRLALYYALRLANGPHPDKKAAADVMRPYFDSPDSTIPPHIRTIYRTFELDTMQTEMAVATIIEDAMQPRYKAFLESLSNKMFRMLGLRALPTMEEKDRVSDIIKDIIQKVADGSLHPQQAFGLCMSMKYKPPVEPPAADSLSADSANVAAVADSAKATTSADSTVSDSTAVPASATN
jgi:hypothetical protein